ncbi:hypothetical protein ACFX2I_013426 [Malus domestica]
MNNLSSLRALDSSPLTSPNSFGSHHHRPILFPHLRNGVICSVKPSIATPSPLSVDGSPNQGINRIESLSQVSGVLGCQWGDEGHHVAQLEQPKYHPTEEKLSTAEMDMRESIINENDFTLRLTEQLLQTEGKQSNLVYLPLSIHMMLSLIAAGSKGQRII